MSQYVHTTATTGIHAKFVNRRSNTGHRVRSKDIEELNVR